MVKQSFDEKLPRLKKPEAEPISAADIHEIRQALFDASSLPAARAARAVAKIGLRDLAPELIAVFNRWL